MNRRHFLSALAAAPLAGADSKPNLIVIVGDDLGYGDLGSFGGTDVPTPHLDSIARNGVRFTDGYVSCPYCSPTRAGIMTGRYQTHFGHEFNPGPGQLTSPEWGLPLTETPMPQRMKALGYRTGAFGKWHLGYTEQYRPMKRGFDEFYGFLGGARDYFDAHSDASNPVWRGDTPVDKIEYTTEHFATEASAFIERNKDKPFFVYLPFNAVHAPMQALKKYTDRFPNIAGETRRTYAGMLSAMDDGIGLVLGTLAKHKLTENTVVVFISDNGGPTPRNTSKNGPLRGYKAQVYEGGLRVPFLMQWPKGIPKGQVYRNPVIALDILPTLTAAAGGKPDASWKLDGVNLLPFLQGKQKTAPHSRLFWRFGEQWAMREGDWKLTSMGGTASLHNLSSDIGEQKDLAQQEPKKHEAMTAAWKEWNKKNIPALWNPRDASQKKQKRKNAA